MLKTNENSPHQYHGSVILASNKGYGFILADDRNLEGDVYFHVSDIVGNDGSDHLAKGDKVSFRLTRTERGYKARLISRTSS